MMGGGAAAAPAAVAAGKATMDLDAVINKSQSFCLNEAAGHPMSNLFVGDDRLYLESGADEQLLLTINFKDTVNLEAISFVGPIDGACLPSHSGPSLASALLDCAAFSTAFRRTLFSF